MSVKHQCCEDFAAARERGTDNEGYGPLVDDNGEGELVIGMDLAPVKFCPWCGVKIEDGHT